MTLDHGRHHTGERMQAANISSSPPCDMYITDNQPRTPAIHPSANQRAADRVAQPQTSTPAARLARPLAQQILASLVIHSNSFIIADVFPLP